MAQLSDQALVSQLPRYLIEVLGFSGILLVVVYLLAQKPDLRDAIPLISLFAFAGYLMLPAANQDCQALVGIRFYAVSARRFAQETGSFQSPAAGRQPHATDQATERFSFAHSLEVRHLSFSYTPDRPPALQYLSLTIPYQSFVGIVGVTGPGKTTLADVLIGLLLPDEGHVLVDGVPLTSANLTVLPGPGGLCAARNLPGRRHHRAQHRLRPAERGYRPGDSPPGRGHGPGRRFH